MSEFAIGQRWFNHAEMELGLGIIVGIEGRHVTISFPAVGTERCYAVPTAPLTRIEHVPGDTICDNEEQSYQVVAVESHQGRLVYIGKAANGEEHAIDEMTLNSFVALVAPQQRLLSGQLDSLQTYQLRCQTLLLSHRLQLSPVKGLLGSRTNLLPHQTYIAYEVAKRFAPRVLLADEVGLGKTIEAGMILHYQLHTGLATRVLIIVPNTLTHQWLVEMLRRFNLRFALFNEERIHVLSEQESNPFETEQLIICSLGNLVGDPGLFQNALDASWDLIVVDEAHHLHWDQGEAGHDYRCIEALAEKCRGLLLLTATPEQIGAASHFARLRLLDPARFHDLDSFIHEEQHYQTLSDTVKILLDPECKPLPADVLHLLKTYLEDVAPRDRKPDLDERERIVSKLLDRHGTGRVFFRNTRAAITGFPKRKLHTYPVPNPECYGSLSGRQTLFPEMAINNSWLQQDPRIQQLSKLLADLRSEKVLVICAYANTATRLEKYLKLNLGIRCAAFYEGLSIIERDRAAAYFADVEDGAQILICSEIGSEGRNFQFAHHLVLFDLPFNPDLLEQRIGRLDRIGQTATINIHVLYIEQSAQAVLFNWYDQGLNIFSESCAAAYSIYEKFATSLNAALDNPTDDIALLIDNTRSHARNVKQALHDGRDRLVELNSCRKDVAVDIINTICEAENPQDLMAYMENMFDVYGVDHEEHSANTWILHTGDHMRTHYFPELGDESMTITFDRNKALSREDLSFVSWEHPMVVAAIEMVLNSEIGNAHIASIELQGIAPGTIMLETFSSVSTSAPKHLQIDRYLPLTPLRTLISKDRKNYAEVLTHNKLNTLCQKVEQQTAKAIIKQLKPEIKTMIDCAVKFTESNLPEVRQAAQKRADTLLMAELERLQQLQKKNKTICQGEIDLMKKQYHACTKAISNAKYKLQAVRLLIAQ